MSKAHPTIKNNYPMMAHQILSRTEVEILIMLKKIGGVSDLTANNLREEDIIVHLQTKVLSMFLEEKILVLDI